MKSTELEARLKRHAETLKDTIEAPFDIESEELVMSKKHYAIKVVALAAAVICIIGTGVFAAVRYLSAKEVADSLGDTVLSEHFGKNETLSETKTDGKYKATILGVANGNEISNFKSSSWDLYPDRTYVAVAVEKSDGSDMTYDDEILVTPLISGLNPWQYNIVTMHGGYSAQIIDGILYRIIECDSIELFADRDLYIAVTDTTFLRNTQYNFDENTGVISANESYGGTNIIFDLELDKSKANQKKAEEYLEKLKNEEDNIDVSDEDDGEDVDTEEFIVDEDFNVRLKEE